MMPRRGPPAGASAHPDVLLVAIVAVAAAAIAIVVIVWPGL
jgi:hypothetical protein